MAIQRSPWRKVVLISSWLFSALIVSSCSNNQVETDQTDLTEDQLSGEVLFMNHCASCHGADGKLGVSGASDLSSSQMSVEEIRDILENGRKGMPVMKEILGSKENLESVSNYVIELKGE